MTVGQGYPCIFCLSTEGDTFIIRLDKRGRVFGKCSACGATCFWPSSFCHRGLAVLWKPLAMAVRQNDGQLGRDLIEESRKRTAKELGVVASTPEVVTHG
jgi:hypothetical protein